MKVHVPKKTWQPITIELQTKDEALFFRHVFGSMSNSEAIRIAGQARIKDINRMSELPYKLYFELDNCIQEVD